MRKRFLALLTGALVLVLSAGVGLSVAGTTASGVGSADDIGVGANDNLGSPYSEEQGERREKAQEMLLKGKIGKGTKVAQVGKGRYVELAREDTDKIFVVLVEFGDERNVQFPDTAAGCTVTPCFPGDNTVQRFDGPLHNEIPKPDRTTDNTTLWQSDFNKSHYEDMYFNRMAKYYETQSSGRYSVDGTVTEWVKVPFNQALYGRNYCGGIVCATTKALVRDALAVWVNDQLKSKPMAEVQAYLRSFDEWDRYDSNGNGKFDEPDGFIDHFQIVHAGGDEAAGDPTYGTDAIWSHRWYANLQGGGPNGYAGVNVGANGGLAASALVPNNPTGVWVGDYTIQPENGGLGVFAHEFGHDLGLPDLYDTSGNTGGAENSTAFWTLMSSGANIGDGGPNGIGDAPTDLGAWEKFQLGWLDYDVAVAGKRSEHDLGPAEGTTRNGKQGLFVVLPDKEKQTAIVPPKTGSWAYWSGAGDNLSNTMRKSFTLAAGSSLSADIWLDTEAHFDYVFLEASTDGTTWTPIKTDISKPVSDDQGNFNGSGAGMGGSSGTYVAMKTTDPLPSGNVQLRFRYQTDQNTGGKGAVIDNIVVTGQSPDGAETDTGWTFNGFSRIQNGIGVTTHFNAYVAENRGYRGYDTSLKTAYNFGFLDSRPDWVESYPYQDGLLISYWDSSQTNNNVGDHPGEGLILPVDAHPNFHHAADGSGALLRPRILAFDSTFSKQDTKAITVHINSKATTIPSQKAVDTFDDTKDWWFNADEHGATGSHAGRYQPGWYGVKVPKTGTTVSIKSGGPQSAKLTVEVAPK